MGHAFDGQAPLRLLHPSFPTSTIQQVVYINTSLKTKALAHQQVPTITCTSSNVVQTVLTAFAQVRGEACREGGWACMAWCCC